MVDEVESPAIPGYNVLGGLQGDRPTDQNAQMLLFHFVTLSLELVGVLPPLPHSLDVYDASLGEHAPSHLQ